MSTDNRKSTNPPPPPEIKKDRPVTQRVSIAYKNDFDDIDALISGINTDKNDNFGGTTMSYNTSNDRKSTIPPPPPQQHSTTSHSTTMHTTTPSNTSTSGSNNLDDIDDILADLSINKPTTTTPSNKQSVQVRSSTTADLNAIDDLLADLTF